MSNSKEFRKLPSDDIIPIVRSNSSNKKKNK